MLSAGLVAGLLSVPGPAAAAPGTGSAPTPTASAPPAGAMLPAGAEATDRVGTTAQTDPALAARAAFGAAGAVTVLVTPQDPAQVPGTTADASARSVAGTSAAGDVGSPVPTASLVKLYLAEGVLAAARVAGAPLPAADLQRIEAMLTVSDDAAASELWVAHDGAAVLADVVARYGLTGTAPPTPDPGVWGSTTTTAADLARFLVQLPDVAHPDDADRVLGALHRATPLGADGFDQSFGLLGADLLEREPDVAAKQGWMCCLDGVRHLHSVGLVAGTVVVLLAAFPTEVEWPAARSALDAAAEAATGS
ncbi:serine hydrolase [Klenkia sp. LSe6-5]|uniref:Serine hydrolase n=1 Tax=Klenkia sesuvii TaxID=3103137 RepID=A0ABU8DTW5_9ACTN